MSQLKKKKILVVLQNCLPKNKCVAIVCNTFNLKNYASAEFTLSGKVHFKDAAQQAAVCTKYTQNTRYTYIKTINYLILINLLLLYRMLLF